jgi:hypothetical protein
LAIIRIDTPSPSARRSFGAVLFAFFAILGAVLSWRVGSLNAGYVPWAAGAALALLYYAIRPLQIPLYKGWMHLVSPIGWVVSHVILAFIYYVVVTPIALVMRIFGRDKLERRFAAVETYWTERPPEIDPGSYFRQS